MKMNPEFCLTPRRTEAPCAAFGWRQYADGDKLSLRHRSDHHLRNALAAADGKGGAAVIDQEHRDLAAIIGIDGSRRVQNGDAMFGRKARARSYLRLEPLRQRDR